MEADKSRGVRAGRVKGLIAVLGTFAMVIGLASCGGADELLTAGTPGSGGGASGNGSSGNGGSGSSGSAWTPGVFKPSANFQEQCAAPRTGTDPITGQPYPDTVGSTLTENNWLRSWTNELYLWYDEVTDIDPSLYATADYFNQLKTFQTDSAGQPKDKFHFTYTTATWESLSTSDVSPGYGATWELVAATPPRELVVAYTTANTPATAANLARGAQILSIDGVDLVNANDQASVNTLNAGMTPATVGETHTFVVQDLGSSTTRTISMTSQSVTENPVPLVTTFATPAGVVGYMVFDDQEETAEAGLIDAVNQLKTAGATELVLDMRYNGGGLLDVASELAYMIAGPGPTAGQTFYNQQFNAKNPSTNPVTGQPLTPTAFHTTTQGFSVTAGQALPSLNLSRVFVLTGPSTCSASEAVMNGLQGVNVKVIQIGDTTCGKPYGFYPQDNCGTTYFSIEFRGINAQMFGDYPDGFTPSNSNAAASGATFPGCVVDDDFNHALGDPAEARLAAALNFASSSACPAPGQTGSVKHAARSPVGTGGLIFRSPLKDNLILRR